MLAIHNHVSLQAKTLEQLGLSFGTSLCHSDNSLWLDCFNYCLELFHFNFNKLPLALDLKLKFILSEVDFIFVCLSNEFEVSIFNDFS